MSNNNIVIKDGKKFTASGAEERLKEYILSKYHSLRKFALSINLSYTTLINVFEHGIFRSRMITIYNICDALEISIDALLYRGEIVLLQEPPNPTINKMQRDYTLSDNDLTFSYYTEEEQQAARINRYKEFLLSKHSLTEEDQAELELYKQFLINNSKQR